MIELIVLLITIPVMGIASSVTNIQCAQEANDQLTPHLSTNASSNVILLRNDASLQSYIGKCRELVCRLFNMTAGIMAAIVALITGLVYLFGLWNQNPGLRTETIEDTNDILRQPFHIENTSQYFAMRNVRAATFIPLAVVTPNGIFSPRFADHLGDIPPGQSVVFDCRPLCDPLDPSMRKKVRAPDVRELSASNYAVVIGIEWRLFRIKRHKTWTLGVNAKSDGTAAWVVTRISKDRLDRLST